MTLSPLGIADGVWLVSQVDPRFENAVNMIRQGVFGWEGYFEELLQTLSGQRDYYLLADDFPAYLEAQVGHEATMADFEPYQICHVCKAGHAAHTAASCFLQHTNMHVERS